MNKYFFIFFCSCMILLIGCVISAKADYSIKLSPKFCEHGLNQPEKGDFAAFVFCDDALGTQIGIILTKPGVGAVASNSKWSTDNRFWQEGLWMTDVMEMVWSKSGNYLYVVTSEVYSDEALYELDLRQRKAFKLLDGKKIKGLLSIDKVHNEKLFIHGKEFRMKD